MFPNDEWRVDLSDTRQWIHWAFACSFVAICALLFMPGDRWVAGAIALLLGIVLATRPKPTKK